VGLFDAKLAVRRSVNRRASRLSFGWWWRGSPMVSLIAAVVRELGSGLHPHQIAAAFGRTC